jgi:hypothetical protein
MNNFLEKTLENIIMSNIDKMPSKGLDIFYKNTVNQIAFNTCVADIFTWEEVDDVLYCRIIELKKDCCDESSFWQVLNYKIDLFIFIHNNYMHIKDVKIELVLIGCTFKDNVEFISNYSGLKLYKYNYGIDGITFEHMDLDFNDEVISELYESNLLKGVNLSKVNSFTDDVKELARGKMSS